ncbi:H/ACA ribonucleoprotein complex subunit 3-like [Paramacrobiotus metropolitanus]|uniref:H/ACA ribonucleoprotein complex subunit 3-like n=1 Tax=Paramacrobiotus metropolitanus TaxID=2943436 RepID=UPI00244599BE|nr:H/ACA ribonucleoprotein complex subunit 3-like [Paramacrobiotus metropolitanus]
MLLRFYLDENNTRVYTLKALDPDGRPTHTAHPAKFSPEDKYSRQRITIKKRFGLLLTQNPKIAEE